MESAGLWMLGGVAGLMLATGLPAWSVLIGVALLASVAGLAFGVLSLPILNALPARLIGLLEQDLLQALPLYVLMGALLNRLPLAAILFRTGTRALGGGRIAALLMSLILGGLLAPVNGSVGASVSMLCRSVLGRLRERGVDAERAAALVCAASTFGVVIPPSLVLILLGDAIMRAHTEALNATGAMARIINTQDVFHAAMLPGALFFLLCLAITAWFGKRAADRAGNPPDAMPSRADWIVAGATCLFLGCLLAGVALGYFYAVEGAAAGAVALLLFGIAGRSLTMAVLREVLRDTLAVSGALFALLAAATMFTLVLRLYGTDRWVAQLIAGAGSGPAVLALVLAVLALCALVLDAFEIIFVVIPFVIPPLLMRVPDAQWVSALTLLVLQASFLLPPLGYAVLMIRSQSGLPLSMRALARHLLPYVAVQLAVLALVLAAPALTHALDAAG